MPTSFRNISKDIVRIKELCSGGVNGLNNVDSCQTGLDFLPPETRKRAGTRPVTQSFTRIVGVIAASNNPWNSADKKYRR